VKLLLDHGASTKVRGAGVLAAALWSPMVRELVDLLIAHGADVAQKERAHDLVRQ
jgi:hypothetical protein